MLFRAELGELGVCQVLSLQVTLSDSSYSRVTGMKDYQVHLKSCDLMQI